MIAYPAYEGLPPWEICYLMLEDKFDYLAYFPDCEWLAADESAIWWAGKELQVGKKLFEYIQKNEK